MGSQGLFSKENRLRLTVVALLLFLGFSQWQSCKNSDKVTELEQLNKAANDTIAKTKNSLGEETASTSLMVVEHASDLLKMKSKDSTIIALQRSVSDYKGKLMSATAGSTSTTDHGHSGTTVTPGEVVIHHGKSDKDTCSCDSIIVYPTYSTSWDEKWSKGSIKATKNGFDRDIKVINEFTVTQGIIKPHWWNEGKPTVEFKNLNPNTTTTELKSVIVDQKPKRIAIGLGATYGYDLFTFKPALTIGITGNWTLLRF